MFAVIGNVLSYLLTELLFMSWQEFIKGAEKLHLLFARNIYQPLTLILRKLFFYLRDFKIK